MNTDLLIIYIRNSRDIYALTEWLQNTLLKKVNRLYYRMRGISF